MGLLNHSVLIAGIMVVAAGSASAHSFSAAPVHTTYHASGRGYSSGNSNHGGFFARLFGFHDRPTTIVRVETYGYPQQGGTVVYGSDAGLAAAYQPVAIPSDEERYRTATGMMLPSPHSLVVLPTSSPTGDVTYIWPNG